MIDVAALARRLRPHRGVMLLGVVVFAATSYIACGGSERAFGEGDDAAVGDTAASDSISGSDSVTSTDTKEDDTKEDSTKPDTTDDTPTTNL